MVEKGYNCHGCACTQSPSHAPSESPTEEEEDAAVEGMLASAIAAVVIALCVTCVVACTCRRNQWKKAKERALLKHQSELYHRQKEEQLARKRKREATERQRTTAKAAKGPKQPPPATRRLAAGATGPEEEDDGSALVAGVTGRARGGSPELPPGWVAQASKSRPGVVVWKNIYTAEKLSWKPMHPASRDVGMSPNLFKDPQEALAALKAKAKAASKGPTPPTLPRTSSTLSTRSVAMVQSGLTLGGKPQSSKWAHARRKLLVLSLMQHAANDKPGGGGGKGGKGGSKHKKKHGHGHHHRHSHHKHKIHAVGKKHKSHHHRRRRQTVAGADTADLGADGHLHRKKKHGKHHHHKHRRHTAMPGQVGAAVVGALAGAGAGAGAADDAGKKHKAHHHHHHHRRRRQTVAAGGAGAADLDAEGHRRKRRGSAKDRHRRHSNKGRRSSVAIRLEQYKRRESEKELLNASQADQLRAFAAAHGGGHDADEEAEQAKLTQRHSRRRTRAEKELLTLGGSALLRPGAAARRASLAAVQEEARSARRRSSLAASAASLAAAPPTHRAALRAFYGKVDPSKVNNVDKILAAYTGKEDQMYDMIASMYPDESLLRASGAGAASGGPGSAIGAGPPTVGSHLSKKKKKKEKHEGNPRDRGQHTFDSRGTPLKHGGRTGVHDASGANKAAATAEAPLTHRAALRKFYLKVNPSKVGNLDGVLAAYKGKEGKLYDMIQAMYPNETLQRAGDAAAASGPTGSAIGAGPPTVGSHLSKKKKGRTFGSRKPLKQKGEKENDDDELD